MKAKKIVLGALCLGICILSLFFFRGVTNVINAIVIPLSLGIFTFSMDFKEKLAVYIGLAIFAFVLFPLQLIFLFFYFLISLLLIYIDLWNLGFLKGFLLLSFSLTLFFTASVFLTDLIFGSKIVQITMSLMGDNILIYLLSVAIQAIVVSVIVLPLYLKILHSQKKKTKHRDYKIYL